MPSSARPPGSAGGSRTAEQAASCLESILSGPVAAVGSKPPAETRQAQHTSGQKDVSCSFKSLQIRERRKFLRNTVRRSLSVLYLTLHRGLFQAWPSGGTVSVATVWIAPQRLDLTWPVPRICWGPAAGPAPHPGSHPGGSRGINLHGTERVRLQPGLRPKSRWLLCGSWKQAMFSSRTDKILSGVRDPPPSLLTVLEQAHSSQTVA